MTDDQLIILMAYFGALLTGADPYQPNVGDDHHDRAARFVAVARKRAAVTTIDGIDVKVIPGAAVAAEIKP